MMSSTPHLFWLFHEQQNNIMFLLPIISFSSVSWFEIIIIASLLMYIVHTELHIYLAIYICVYIIPIICVCVLYIYIYNSGLPNTVIVKLLLIMYIRIQYTISCSDKNKILLYFVRKRRWLFKKCIVFVTFNAGTCIANLCV